MFDLYLYLGEALASMNSLSVAAVAENLVAAGDTGEGYPLVDVILFGIAYIS